MHDYMCPPRLCLVVRATATQTYSSNNPKKEMCSMYEKCHWSQHFHQQKAHSTIFTLFVPVPLTLSQKHFLCISLLHMLMLQRHNAYSSSCFTFFLRWGRRLFCRILYHATGLQVDVTRTSSAGVYVGVARYAGVLGKPLEIATRVVKFALHPHPTFSISGCNRGCSYCPPSPTTHTL
jgi:hypothetical protein